jgi:hypothetical protein
LQENIKNKEKESEIMTDLTLVQEIGYGLFGIFILSIPFFIYVWHRSEDKLKLVTYYFLYVLLSLLIGYVMTTGNTISIGV